MSPPIPIFDFPLLLLEVSCLFSFIVAFASVAIVITSKNELLAGIGAIFSLFNIILLAIRVFINTGIRRRQFRVTRKALKDPIVENVVVSEFARISIIEHDEDHQAFLLQVTDCINLGARGGNADCGLQQSIEFALCYLENSDSIVTI
ncbi:hypothetical protein VNO78_27185 [Psophocarpus tetragonolobus]|uniref:Uncharacterized protein n=1 Tax=Psophocarpus tetragonolobus TaxID=3891 RepID=A0AAN9XA91_PSOTE